MTGSDDFPTTARPHARRDILVAAWEEDAVFDLLRYLAEQHGETDRFWLSAIAREAERGTLTAYRYGTGSEVHEPVDAIERMSKPLGRYDKDTIYLSRTDTTLPEIQALPPPAPDSPQWIIGLWGQRPPTSWSVRDRSLAVGYRVAAAL